jgi:tRNA threonylcarbamoyladenosine biosynthesis protein TsaB
VIVLGIDTASVQASVAVVDGDRLLAERRWAIETTASRELLAAIDGVLGDAGVARGAIEAIAVDIGPGGYGPLRTGVATAQGMAMAFGVPLAGVGRLQADAFPVLAPDRRVVAVHDAGRSGIAWAAYQACEQLEVSQEAPPEQLIAPRIDTVTDCLALAPRGAYWCGEVSKALQEALAAHADARVVSGDTGTRSAAGIARLARLQRAFGDAAAVDVMYLRPPSIGARAS